MVKQSRATAIQEAFAAGGLTGMFVEELGWESPLEATVSVEIDGQHFVAEVMASLRGFRIYAVATMQRPSRQVMRRVDGTLAELSPERLEVFQSADAWFWHWPRRTSAGTTTFESVETAPRTLPTFLAQRLSGLEFSINELRKGISIVDVRDRVHGHFDASPVTKKFYDRFQKEQLGLSKAIEGLPEEEAAAYSTTLMNRLMFIYFMQKKEFLNGDPRFLENTLDSVRELRGPDHYYSFYRDALLPLFFEKLNNRAGRVSDLEIDLILGDVPYVNGGIFGRTEVEDHFAESLRVPDEAFGRILAFFSEFNWHLDTRPTGHDNEINPEVIGYIFEQYINFASSGKKENGAYYTPHDVTAYMVAQTLVPRILDDFDRQDVLFAALRSDPDRYIQPAMLHGWVPQSETWSDAPSELVDCWEGDPTGWTRLDLAPILSEVNLPGESWVETFHRRARVESLRKRILNAEVVEVNDLITENLNGQLLLTDGIDALDDGFAVAGLFDKVTQLSVFDPTCGSGAFLFAALEVLEDVYAHLIDEARSLENDAAVTTMLVQVDAQPSQRYFIRKHIAIRNLYGTDLMPGAIETAKLRIFLALAACVDTREQLRPLPDLDFNLKVGNLVVGFKDADDAENRLGVDFVNKSYLDGLAPRLQAHALLYKDFSNAIESEGRDDQDLKERLKSSEAALRQECHSVYASIAGVTEEGLQKWIDDTRPFHWFCEFPGVLARGGFDVVIGNPPYVKMKQLPGYSAVGYRTSGCPDLYAVCYERSLALTSSRGRHAFVVMLNMSFSDDFGPLREVISGRQGAEWWSTFGKRPDSLFRGVQVRNTLLVVGPGGQKLGSKHNIFGRETRDALFQNIEYDLFDREHSAQPIRGGVVNPLLNAVNGLSLPSSGRQGTENLVIRPTGQYWFPVLFGVPPVLDERGEVLSERDHRVREIRLSSAEDALITGAALAGKLSFAWWSATGDDFDVNPDEADLGRKAAAKVSGSTRLRQLAADVREAGKQAAFVSKNNDGYINVRWTSLRDVTDRFDQALLEELGLEQHWRALNIWYRQCMKSTRANTNSRLLTPEEVQKYLRW
jgi:hypothetical protein